MTEKLSGKVAIVTGGSRGIGAAIVARLASDGADVAFTYVSSSERASALLEACLAKGVRATATQADSGIARDITRFVQDVHEQFGRIDILVNSAGVSLMGNVTEEGVDTEMFDRQFEVNVKGVSAAVRSAVPLMSSGGRIVTIGSVFASSSPLAGWGDYSASKAAVAAYTRAWARDLGPIGITVNIIQAGPIDTEQNPADSAHAPTLSKMTALGRYGRSDEVASAVAFLASSDTSYITGVTLNVDGGFLA